MKGFGASFVNSHEQFICALHEVYVFVNLDIGALKYGKFYKDRLYKGVQI